MNQVVNELSLTSKQQEMFKTYFDFLVNENEKYNLTSIKELDEVYVKHFYDSLAVLNYIDLNNKSLCDIGSGAGFPGIPIKIVNENLKLTIIEPTLKRVNFLKELCFKLGLKDVEIICDRAENAINSMREKYDYVCARAVSNLPVLLELTIPFVKVGGSFIAYKGSNYQEEIDLSKNALKKLNSKIENIYNYDLLLDMGERSLIEVRKLKETDKSYPRDYAKIKKKPL